MVTRKASAPIPTGIGKFRLFVYEDLQDGKEHLAVVHGRVRGREGVLVRVHSECFTGDVLSSRRCDCGEQLKLALRQIVKEGAGVLLYLRQEGRGIGLLNKLRAYNLQDQGFDTVDANLALGHAPDERDYAVAAHVLRDLKVKSIRLLTNNPQKLGGLEDAGIAVAARVPLMAPVTPENAFYLQTKARRLNHQLDLRELQAATPAPAPANGVIMTRVRARLKGAATHRRNTGRPLVTLSYAQSLDGSIAARSGHPLALSGSESLVLTHRLRAAHDAILVGIGTVLADNPRLNVRLVPGPDPQPVVVDSRLRFPPYANLLHHTRPPWIATGNGADPERRAALENAGARVFPVASNNGWVDLASLLKRLGDQGINSLMVEGGAQIITSFLTARLVDQVVITLAPMLVGGLRVVDRLGPALKPFPRLRRLLYQPLGEDLALWGEPDWGT